MLRSTHLEPFWGGQIFTGIFTSETISEPLRSRSGSSPPWNSQAITTVGIRLRYSARGSQSITAGSESVQLRVFAKVFARPAGGY